MHKPKPNEKTASVRSDLNALLRNPWKKNDHLSFMAPFTYCQQKGCIGVSFRCWTRCSNKRWKGKTIVSENRKEMRLCVILWHSKWRASFEKKKYKINKSTWIILPIMNFDGRALEWISEKRKLEFQTGNQSQLSPSRDEEKKRGKWWTIESWRKLFFF